MGASFSLRKACFRGDPELSGQPLGPDQDPTLDWLG